MKLLRPARSRLIPLMLAAWLAGTVSADPLHSLGSGRTWRHEHSGWLFPPRVAGLDRIGTPYSLDGGEDVGAQYGQAAAGIELDLEVHTVTGVRPVPAGLPFRIEGAPDIVGFRAAGVSTPHGVSADYRLHRDHWVVHIRATVHPDGASLDAADTAVRSLPWDSLGSNQRLH